MVKWQALVEVRRFNFFPQTLKPKRSLKFSFNSLLFVSLDQFLIADARMATSHWGDLLEGLFLRVLDCFDYKER